MEKIFFLLMFHSVCLPSSKNYCVNIKENYNKIPKTQNVYITVAESGQNKKILTVGGIKFKAHRSNNNKLVVFIYFLFVSIVSSQVCSSIAGST
jgi:hypothetical protein